MDKIKICISTDSRGTVAGPLLTWDGILYNKKDYDIDFTRWHCAFFTTMWDHVLELQKKNKQFDIGVFQVGYHDYVAPWTMPVWRSLGLSEENLNVSLKVFPEQTIAGHFFKNCFTYRNDKVIENLFIEARKYCKKLLFIEMPYSWEPYVENTKIMNEVFSKFCDASVPLPMTEDFPIRFTLNSGIDRVHYTDEYHKILSNLVLEQIQKMI